MAAVAGTHPPPSDPGGDPSPVVLRAEHGHHPLRLAESTDDDNSDVNPRDLDLSPELVERLGRWAAWYDATLRDVAEDEARFATEAEAANFEREGIELWHTLRDELSGRRTVLFWSPLRAQLIEDPGAQR